MVRNVASTQSLRDEMNHFTIGSQPEPSHNTPEPPLQRFDTSGASMQLCGNDAYTKSLMQKVASGQATDEETAAFNKHVNQARSLPSIQNLLQRPEEESSRKPRAELGPLGGEPGQPFDLLSALPPNFGERIEQANAISEQEQREGQTEEVRQKWRDFHARDPPPPGVPARIKLPENFKTAAQLDYDQQLRLLEAQNKKRLLQARMEQTSKPTMIKDMDEISHQRATDRAREPNAVPLSADLSAELDELARQSWKKELRDCVPGYDPYGRPLPTGQDYSPFEQAGRQSARKSKGLAATHAANQEALRFREATSENAAKYTKPFCKFLTENPTVFHAVDALKQQLKQKGWTELSERQSWDIKPEGKYFVERNGSSLIAFAVGAKYKPGNGAAILAGHVDALTTKLKPISQVPNKAGYLQLGVAPYAGALNSTWWDRDLSIGGRVHIRDGDKIVTKLVKLDWPIARVPTLAPHFGATAAGPFNKETQMVPIIGLESSDSSNTFGTYPEEDGFSQPPLVGSMGGKVGYFVETQPPALVKVIGEALGLNASSYTDIVNWELELFDVQPATVGGINKEFIFAGRIDDKLCSWAALQALIESQENDTAHSGIIKVVGLFDDEEIGSLLRQGAKGNFLPSTMERAVGSFAGHHPNSDLMGRTYANSFMVSSDVTHAVNPNFLGAYLENHAPHLNVGLAIAADPNGHMTTDSVSTTILKRCADKVGAKLQVFQIRNDSRSGGTVGPMLSSAIGVRSIDAGLAQLSMHSIRATTGALDPGLGVLTFAAFLNGFEAVDKEFQE